MFHRIYKIIALGFATVLTVLGCAGAAAQSRATYPPEHVVHLVAISKIREWRSPQHWGPREQVVVQPFVEGKEVDGIGGNGNCHILFAGRGLVAHVNICGRKAVPIRIKFRSLERGPVHFTVRYGSL